MAHILQNKRILLGITGSIAAYKSADLVRRLRDLGAVVRVAMTENAKRFITPLTMQAVSGNPVHDDLFDLQAEAAMGHIELARWADLILIAPASADCMARLVYGNANDLLTTICLATKSPIAIAPAMNQGMWQHATTQEHAEILQRRGVAILGPGVGSQACGEVGPGRMLEPAEIIEEFTHILTPGVLTDYHVVITAGPTQEAIDPVRYLSNHSSGKMGYALAAALQEARATVTLISGPVALSAPTGVTCIRVASALEMRDAVMNALQQCDVFIGVAAVADYRCEKIESQKLHKETEQMQLTLIRNPDIISEVSARRAGRERPYIVGFAAETENVLEQARAKRKRKQMDMIIANLVGKDLGMGTDNNSVTIITDDGEVAIAMQPKRLLARTIVQQLSNILQTRKITA